MAIIPSDNPKCDLRSWKATMRLEFFMGCLKAIEMPWAKLPLEPMLAVGNLKILDIHISKKNSP